jgi:two-component system, NtrC family, response regulator HydG
MRTGTNAVLSNRQPFLGSEETSSSRALSEMNHCASVQPCRKRAASLLVIGANVEDRVAISETLGTDAYEIVFCDSLAPDMHLLDERPFDACMIELSRPVETSFDLLAAIKRKCPLAEVVILSRLAEEDLWIESIQRGAYDFLPTPLDRKELQRILANAVEKNRLEDR